ncbi:hypothetical protein L6164_001094 [Bauhinia variegata]|uniref:Uncharacterized protein n=1 Tax=Bauhinia variegata TaxID=167791 RepID=A0ACB9Q8P3_BAUVA|nr:hypothetical protein L6164_001094 [Bauhinia variegata]
MELIDSVFSFLLSMRRNVFHMGRRTSHRVSSFSSYPQKPSYLFSGSLIVSSSLSQSRDSFIACPLVWFAGFLFVMRFPFVSQPDPEFSFDDFSVESIRSVLKQGNCDDQKIVRVFNSALTPIWVYKILVKLREDPKLALKMFKWAGTQNGFHHTTESYCILAHILFCGMLFLDAKEILRKLVF